MKVLPTGRILITDSNGDGIELPIGAACCSNDLATRFANVLNSIFQGEVSFKDYTDSNGNTTYAGMKVAFLDKDGNILIETDIDANNGKPDYLTDGYKRTIVFKGSKTGTDSSTAYITKVRIILVGIDTESNTAVEFTLGETDAPAKNPLAKVIPGTTNTKGLETTLDKTFRFEFGFEIG